MTIFNLKRGLIQFLTKNPQYDSGLIQLHRFCKAGAVLFQKFLISTSDRSFDRLEADAPSEYLSETV